MKATVRYETTTGCTAAGVARIYGDVLMEDARWVVVITDELTWRIPIHRVIDVMEANP